MRSALKTYFNARDVEISNVVKVDTYTDTILDVVKCNGKKETGEKDHKWDFLSLL